VHTVSHALVDHFAAEGFRRDRLVAVVNGVDAERFSPGDRRAARERLGWTPEMLVLGMVGTMQRRKRHDDVLTAFEQLAATTPDLRLLIVGEGGSETTAVRARVQASRWRERIHLAGFQPEPQAYYPAIDLLLVPSTNEGLSNATLEAMACEVPVLTHTACGNADIIKPGVDGFVVELAGAADLARCLAEVVARREQLPQMGRLARAKVVQTFSLRQMAAEYAKLYHKLAGQGKKA
jgi:glycosyltransferase involved in cell wall biosynthesis